MTALAWSLAPDRVTVATDTLHTMPAPAGEVPRHRPAALRSKIMVLADLRMAIVTRGPLAEIGHTAFLNLLSDWRIASGDEAFAALPALFSAATDHVTERVLGGPCDWLDRVLCEVASFGWSAAAGRFRGFYSANFRLAGYPGGFVPVELEDGVNAVPAIAPEAFERATAGGGTVAQLVGLLSHLKATHDATGDGGVGGEVDVATLMRSGVRQGIAHRFADADQVAGDAVRHRVAYDRDAALAALRGAMQPADLAGWNETAAARGHYLAET